MGQTYDIDETQVNALRAILARIQGQWNNPHLVAIGALSIDPIKDITMIAIKAIDKFETENY